jgi:hypothetical protein
MTSSPAYPVRLTGRLDERLSRWKWLLKWLFVVPHVVVLVFLWVASALLTIVAGVSVLITGRYPRALFDFNVGVFRWTWRVEFYGFSALGTDAYPPFSLRSDPAYPADLDIDYPEHLSRGLVLVKWWLLALPQYLVVSLLAGGFGIGHAGLITVLVLVAGVTLAATGRYPKELFDLVLGLNRWCFRVLAYAALMRDEYPPFRLDLGGQEPALA